jgi:hypothetical protein
LATELVFLGYAVNLNTGHLNRTLGGCRPKPPALFVGACVFVLAAHSNCLFAANSFYETEPNNTPAEANAVSGAVTLFGALSGSDQDGFKWLVSDVDASKRWTLELKGIPGRLTIVDVIRLKYAENGVDVEGFEKLFTIGSRDGSRPGLAENVLFEPGEYILGIAHGGDSNDSSTFRPPVDSISFGEEAAEATQAEEPGAYRLHLREGEFFSVWPRLVDNAVQQSAYDVNPGGRFGSFSTAQDSWFKVVISEDSAQKYWDFGGQAPVSINGEAFLRNAEGEQLAHRLIDRLGKFSFPDLGLAAGDYLIEVKTDATNSIRFFQSAETGQRIEGREAEPNNHWVQANRFPAGASIEGRLVENGDNDVFRLMVDEKHAEQRSSLQLQKAEGQGAELCLLDGKGQRVQCRNGNGLVELTDLVLTPGEWGISVGHGADTAYTLSLVRQSDIEPDYEAEPNDLLEYASGIPAKNRIKGRIAGFDRDFYRLVISENAQLWRFQVVGEGVDSLSFYDGAGFQNKTVRSPPGAGRLRLENVYLLPGTHYVSITGPGGGDYTLLARPLGQPDPNGEFEPNDDISSMQPLYFGQTRTGLLQDVSDKDNYRFHLANWDRIRLTITPPPDGRINANHYWDVDVWRQAFSREPGGELVVEGLFPPGDYRMELIAAEPSDAEYTIKLERLERYGCPADCEPNDNPALANPLPANHVIDGHVGEWRDWDWYELPAFEHATTLSIRQQERRHVEVSRDMQSDSLVAWDEADQAFKGLLPAGQATYLMVRDGGNPDYRLELNFSDGPEAIISTGPPPVSLDIELEATGVSAYRPYGQVLQGRLVLNNNGTEPLEMTLQAATSDRRWNARLDDSSVNMTGGSSLSVPLQVSVPDDAWADRPVRISLAAFAPDGSHVESFKELTVGREVPAIKPRQHWRVPDELLGGFNVVQQNLGGSLVSEPDRNIGWPEKLIDGLAIDGEGLQLRGGYVGPRAEVVYKLAGDAPVEIAGVAVNLLFAQPLNYVRQLDLWASLDGANYEPVIRERLDPLKTEQVLVLEKPVSAKFIKLVVGDDFTGRPHSASSLGEVKIIARPGFDLSSGQGFNLAAPELGGHVVWADPQISLSRDREILTEAPERLTVGLKPGQALEWVIGFHHNRAARIARLEWVNPPNPSGYHEFTRVLVAASLDSPIGPWKPVGEWELAAGEQTQQWVLEQPDWARFLKFSAPGPEIPTTTLAPDTLRVFEAPTSGDYRSILGEWGFDSQSAIYEFLHGIDYEPALTWPSNDARERAAELSANQRVSGLVQLGTHVNWYRLTMPADHNALSMTMTGESTVRTVIRLENEAGESIPVRTLANESTPARHVLEAIAEPGSTVYLKVEEPPRNVAFLWDTSPSVAPFVPMIYNAMITYAGDLVPGQDAANFVPYGSRLLLKDWYGEPYFLQTVLNEYPRSESSSAAEETMDTASRALAMRAGTKAIINVTDAATGRYVPVWERFSAVKPRIFNLRVSSAGAFARYPPTEEDLMQDWSRINGGHYQYMLSHGEMAVAFDRAATLLRRPADYTLQVSSLFREAPGPGTLSVVVGKQGTSVGSGGIELILDASGSMLKQLDGKRRIAIAKEVLSEAVTRFVPAGTPLALRVFGHKEPNACRTDLEIPLQLLDVAATVKVIAGINAMNLAKTPIAASLAAAEFDLGNSQGRRVIVLLTDGEETCDGDPEQVIRALQDKGLVISLNIVGFAIDDAALEAQFESWAKAGNGRYFSAEDQEGLSESLAEALQTPFTVFDSSGAQVASGVAGGEAIELNAGFYRVVVYASPQQVFDLVEIPGEEDVVIELNP